MSYINRESVDAEIVALGQIAHEYGEILTRAKADRYLARAEFANNRAEFVKIRRELDRATAAVDRYQIDAESAFEALQLAVECAKDL